MKALSICLALLTGAAHAGQLDAIPSCYARAKLDAAPPKTQTALFVLVDQTTPLDGALKQSLADQAKPFIHAGNAFTVVRFSAFSQGQYLDVLTTGRLEAPLPSAARNDIGKPVLQQFDACLKQQQQLAFKLVGGALKQSLDGTSSNLAKSDVLASLKNISRQVKQTAASEKVVLISSDMLENSTVSSFYSKQAVRKIDPVQELDNAVKNDLIADFGGARVYVQGAGLVSEAGQSRGVYRDPKTMAALRQFWTSYFQRSNAKLVEFGQPALLGQVQ
ncbi:hypothetical protein JHS3_18660 [Jeongeupia sp. HS-3]|uniref:hypothetical protein n=1 Tax=Jeongeupia sp. HS-3 TaxID=1009682 RepID=UPI0018A3D3A0|nr:hypothetical protein [Jeongeupia sp. HS-3]BCL76130.1 hypothetical protein JHS3_18660 [Jeongeupia sp. HS-3]